MNQNQYPLSAVVQSCLVGKTASERKMSVVCSTNDETALRGLSHGAGKVAKEAGNRLKGHDAAQIAYSIGMGNLAAFAAIYAGKTGNDVRFGAKHTDGTWARKPSDDFRAFEGVLLHALLQLEVKGKDVNAKGLPSAAAADLQGLMSLHRRAVEVMNEGVAADADRRARMASEQTTLAIAAELDRIDAEIEAGETI